MMECPDMEIVQDLLFPKRVVRYVDPARHHAMSHIQLRRRRTGKRHHPVPADTDHQNQNVEDEMKDPDIDINELLVAEFKLMNDQMRSEIRSLYRLLFIFVIIVMSMGV